MGIRLDFTRKPAKLGGMKSFSIPTKMWGSVDMNKEYHIIVLEVEKPKIQNI